MIKLKIKEKISIKLRYKSLKVSDKIKDTHLFRKKRHNQTLIQTKFDNFEENPTFSTLDSLMISKFEPKTDVATTRAVSELKRKRKKSVYILITRVFVSAFASSQPPNNLLPSPMETGPN